MWKRHWLFYVILVVELQYQFYGTVYTTTIKIYEPTSHEQLYRNNNLTLKRKRTNLIVIYVHTQGDRSNHLKIWRYFPRIIVYSGQNRILFYPPRVQPRKWNSCCSNFTFLCNILWIIVFSWVFFSFSYYIFCHSSIYDVHNPFGIIKFFSFFLF